MPTLLRPMILVSPSRHSGEPPILPIGKRLIDQAQNRRGVSKKRFEAPAKWCPTAADRIPGLMPTNTMTPLVEGGLGVVLV